jgi:carboxylesterase type B
VALKQPVIWVAINYRLGLFGFATSDAIVQAKHGNAGLRDQRAAMEWVRDHIKVFGGDPRRVTVIGQSVGASDTTFQMTAFDGERGAPFQQAFLMSGAPGVNFNTDSNLVSENTAEIARQVGCLKGDSQSLETLQCMRSVPFETLTNLSVAASRAARPPFGEGFFYPTLDGDFLRDRPSELVRAGKIAKGIPILASWVTNDGAWYASPDTKTDEDVLGTFGLWLNRLSKATNEKLLQLYPLSDFEHLVRPEYDGPITPQYYRAAQLNRDLWFTCPVIDFAWQYARNGGVDVSDVRLAEHNATRYTPVFEHMGVPMWRVSHLSDIPYVLNLQNLGGGADNSAQALELSSMTSESIIRFAASGNPNGHGETNHNAWPPAFADTSKEQLRQSTGPVSFSLQLTGGPYHHQPVMVNIGKDSENSSSTEDAVRWEKLVERCQFINSDQVRREAGV